MAFPQPGFQPGLRRSTGTSRLASAYRPQLGAESHLGVFEILAPLGEGGMGEVYRAKETKVASLTSPSPS